MLGLLRGGEPHRISSGGRRPPLSQDLLLATKPGGLASQPASIRWAAYYALVVAILFFGSFTQAEFIYFQF